MFLNQLLKGLALKKVVTASLQLKLSHKKQPWLKMILRAFSTPTKSQNKKLRALKIKVNRELKFLRSNSNKSNYNSNKKIMRLLIRNIM